MEKVPFRRSIFVLSSIIHSPVLRVVVLKAPEHDKM